MKQVKTPADVPDGEHYAVIEFRKVTEATGWGSENDSQVLAPDYYVTQDLVDWNNHIKALEKVRPYTIPYVALHVKSKAKIVTEIIVSVSVP